MKYFKSIPTSRLNRWNARQRKKLRIGEFQELGFTLYLTFNRPLDEAAYEVFWDAIIPSIEDLGLCVGGLGGGLPIAETEGFITCFTRGSVTLEQLNSLLAWCRAHPAVKEAHASERVDAWHGGSEA